MSIQPILLGALTGLASSAHCAAMCGPLAASSCTRRNPRMSLARYQLGRMLGYGAAGAIAGGLGHVVALAALAPWLAYAVPVLTALALIALAQRVWSGQSRLVQLGARTRSDRPVLFARVLRLVPREPAALGALSALLPCAALGAALLLAAGTQGRASGAALMLGFAATSAVGVLGGGVLLARLAQLGGRFAPRALAAGLVLAALYVGLSPVYAQLNAASGSPSTPSCH